MDVSVVDTGTGIRDIHAALTLGSRSSGEADLNEHGMSLKHTLSSACKDSWSIQTRTPKEPDVMRTALEENTYCSLNLRLKRDLFGIRYDNRWSAIPGASTSCCPTTGETMTCCLCYPSVPPSTLWECSFT